MTFRRKQIDQHRKLRQNPEYRHRVEDKRMLARYAKVSRPKHPKRVLLEELNDGYIVDE